MTLSSTSQASYQGSGILLGTTGVNDDSHSVNHFETDLEERRSSCLETSDKQRQGVRGLNADIWRDHDINQEEEEEEEAKERKWQPPTTIHPPPPPLAHNQLRILFTLMGMGMLFPYNALVSCVDYFTALHPNASDVGGQLAASCISALLVTTIILLPLSTKTPSSSSTKKTRENVRTVPARRDENNYALTFHDLNVFASPTKRVLIGYILVLCLLLILSTLSNPSMTVLNTLSYLVGTADATSQSGLYVFAASYHVPAYSASVTLGSAVAGLAVSLLRLITRGWFETTTVRGLRHSSALLFVLCACVLGLCIWSLLVVVRDRQQVHRVKHDDDDKDGEREFSLGKNEKGSEDCIICNGRNRGVNETSLSHFPSEDDTDRPSENSPVLGRDKRRSREGGIKADATGENVAKSSEMQDTWCENEEKSIIVSSPPSSPLYVSQTVQDLSSSTSSACNISRNTHQKQNDDTFYITTNINDKTSSSSCHDSRAKWCYYMIVHNPRVTIFLQTLRVTWKATFSAFFNFFITLSLFPGTVTSIQSIPSPNNGGDDDDDTGEKHGGILSIHLDDWLPVVLIMVFNLADCVGRVVLGVEKWGVARALLVRMEDANVLEDEEHFDMDRNPVAAHDEDIITNTATAQTKAPKRVLLPNYDKFVWYQTHVRIIFYPLLAMCVLPEVSNPIITSDLLRCFIVFIFGFTNGFITCANFMVAPTMVYGEQYRDAASLLVLLAIYTGLTAGAYFGLLVDWMLSSIGGER